MAACGLAVSPALLLAVALTVSGYALPIDGPAPASDAIVVLGGFGVPRAERAARLFADGLAPTLIVSGAGDCVAMQLTLVANGVPANVIEAECASRSTYENAAATVALMRRRNLRAAVIVTHWFHARRAIATFRAAAPDIRFSAISIAGPATPRWRLGWTTQPAAVLAEYVKIVWYAVAHGVFIRLAPEPLSGAGP